MVICKEIDFGSSQYEATVELRYELLRKPLGLLFTKAQLAAEINDHHLAAYENDELLACMVLSPRKPGEVQMRQVAVSSSRQRTGIGKQFVAFAEEFAKRKGYGKMMLHARDVAVPFYLKLNYLIKGEAFTEVNIPHRYMEKAL